MLNSQQGILCCLRLTSSKILPHFILVSRGTVANKLYIASSMSCNNFVAVLNRFKTGAWFYSVQPHLPAAPAATKNATTQVHYVHFKLTGCSLTEPKELHEQLESWQNCGDSLKKRRGTHSRVCAALKDILFNHIFFLQPFSFETWNRVAHSGLK